MKRKLLLVGVLGFTVLFGCNQSNNKVKASVPDGFELISNNELKRDDYSEVKHIETGCHYIVYSRGQSMGITQMYNKEGLPYCD